MSTEVENLHLQKDDTVVTVRDRLSGLRGKRVLLIWPASGSNLRRKLDLVLIQREAYRRAIQLAIVAQDDDLRAFAAELNISCFPSIKRASTSAGSAEGTKSFSRAITNQAPIFWPKTLTSSPDASRGTIVIHPGEPSLNG